MVTLQRKKSCKIIFLTKVLFNSLCEHTAASKENDFLFLSSSVFGAWKESPINHSALLGLHKGALLPGVPTLKRQSWWPPPLAGPFLKACLSAGFSPLSGQFPKKQWKWNTLSLDSKPYQEKVLRPLRSFFQHLAGNFLGFTFPKAQMSSKQNGI